MDTQSPETTESSPTSRRALIASLIGAGVAVVAAGKASAADSTSDTVATTVAPPARSAADTAVLNSLLALEADNVATYAAAKAKTSGDDLAALDVGQVVDAGDVADDRLGAEGAVGDDVGQ